MINAREAHARSNVSTEGQVPKRLQEAIEASIVSTTKQNRYGTVLHLPSELVLMIENPVKITEEQYGNSYTVDTTITRINNLFYQDIEATITWLNQHGYRVGIGPLGLDISWKQF